MPRVAEPSAPKYTAALNAPEPGFAEVVGMIREARTAAHDAVNTALIDLYWRVGGYITDKVGSAAWGDGVVRELQRRFDTQLFAHGGVVAHMRPFLARSEAGRVHGHGARRRHRPHVVTEFAT